MDLDKINEFNEKRKLEEEKRAAEEAQRQLNKQVTDSVKSGAKVTTSAILSANRKSTEELGKELRQSGDKVLSAMQESQDTIAGALNNLVLATVISKDPKVIETAKAFAGLLGEIAKASNDFKGSKLNLLPVANEKLATSIDKLANKVVDKPDKDYTKDLEAIRTQISKLNLNVQPVVNVPESKVDIQPITDAVKELKTFVGKQKAPSVSIDMESVVKGLDSVKKTISNLSFPVPNYVLPFKNTQGAAAQVQLDSDGKVPVSGSFSVDTSALATSANQTSGSQKTQIVDSGGEAATVTGGKLDVNASVDTTGLATSAKQDTSNTSLSSIDGKITAVNTGAVVVSSSALPSGAATAAKQPALGTAGTSSADVITVQGRAAMTPLLTDGSATTQPVSNAGLTELAAAINSNKLDINIVSSDVATGGTSAADDADFTDGTTPGTPGMGVYESTPTTVTDGDLGVVGITETRRLKTSATIDAAIPAGNNNIGDVDVASSALPTGASTSAKQDTVIGHLDGVEGLLTTIDGDTGNISTKIDTIAGAISGAEAQVDVVTSALPTGASTSAKQDTAQTALDAIAASLSVIDDWDSSDTAKVTLQTGSAAIGKLAANSGVDIGDVDVTSLPATPAGTNAIGKMLPPDVDVTTHTNYAKKYYTNSGAVTDGIVWSPAAGKRWHVVSMFINVSAAATVTFEDDKAGGDEAVMKMELAANSGVAYNFAEKYPLASGEDAADLLVTTSAGNVYITVTGYEI